MSPGSTRGDAALRRCIACPSEEFFGSVWGRRPMLSRAAELGHGFTDLLDEAAVDALASTHALRTPFLRMAKDGVVQAPATFTRGGGAGAGIADQVADDKVLAAMDGGATLVLQALHRSWPPLVHFGGALAAELGHPVQINSYVTPPQNQGFSPHYDVHDVFVLQVTGRKHWTIHEPVVHDPLAGQPWDAHKPAIARRVADDAALIDTVLEPGDALYLPRGTIHSAKALGETSIHLTVGVHPVTRHHLVEHLLARAAEEPALRASLPAGVDLSDPAVLAAELAETAAQLTRLLAGVEAADVARLVGADLMRRTRPEPVGPLAQLTAAAGLGPATQVRLRAGLRFRLESAADGGLSIVLLDRTVTVPATVADAVKLLVSGQLVSPADLPAGSVEDAVAVTGRLLREGVIVPA